MEAGPEALGEDKINIPGMPGPPPGPRPARPFTTVPQAALNNRVLTQPRGKVLGGSSVLNLMCWDRGSKQEYDWDRLGNDGWDWDSMLPAMMSSENFTRSPGYGSEGMGFKGPVKTVVNRKIPEHQTAWIPTLENLGIPQNTESLAGSPIGVDYQPSSIDPVPWNRSYSATAYLPRAGRDLRVLTDTRVAKVNLEKAGGGSYVATGITLVFGLVFLAAEEVVLSAGSIQSPGLLELSGVGQSGVLAAAGVKQLINLPGVGENLQDHVRIQASYQLKDNYTSFDVLRYNATFAAEQLALYRAGQLSWYDYTASAYLFAGWRQVLSGGAAAALQALARGAPPNSTADRTKVRWLSDPQVPQLEIIFSDGYTGVRGYPAAGSPLYGKNFFTLIAGVMHPLSRGSVHIASANVSAKPVLDPRYLSHPYDVQAAVEGVKAARRLAHASPLRDTWVAEYEPGADVVPDDGPDADAKWRDYVLGTALSIYHPAGTCAMLPRADGGVVDPELVVYGSRNLRVVVARVIPVLMSGHIQTAAYGIAERAADIIVEGADRRRRRRRRSE